MRVNVLNRVSQWQAVQLAEQFAESAKLEAKIRKNLAGLGYGG